MANQRSVGGQAFSGALLSAENLGTSRRKRLCGSWRVLKENKKMMVRERGL